MKMPTAWRGAPIDAERELMGSYVCLEPLREVHAADLYAAGRPEEVWGCLGLGGDRVEFMTGEPVV